MTNDKKAIPRILKKDLLLCLRDHFWRRLNPKAHFLQVTFFNRKFRWKWSPNDVMQRHNSKISISEYRKKPVCEIFFLLVVNCKIIFFRIGALWLNYALFSEFFGGKKKSSRKFRIPASTMLHTFYFRLYLIYLYVLISKNKKKLQKIAKNLQEGGQFIGVKIYCIK